MICKSAWVICIAGCMVQFANAQHIKPARYTILPGDSLVHEKCPAAFLAWLTMDSLKTNAALFVFNSTPSPVERNAFRDNEAKYSSLHKKFKMNSCMVLYVDSGVHRFHTIYQKPADSIIFKPGDIYFAEITRRTTWPPFFPARKKNSEGEKIEYGPALLYFKTPYEALICLEKIKNKQILKNR